MSDPVVFSSDAARRIAREVRKSERAPQPGLSGQSQASDNGYQPTQFVIASDYSQYTPPVGANGSIPYGYDSYAIGYRMQAGCDIAKLPLVPDVATLLDGSAEYVGNPERGPVLDWVSFKWVGQYEDDTWGRPVLINVNRLFRGYVFRGEFVQACQMPGMLHGYSGSGTAIYPWAPSVANLSRIDPVVESRMECGAGWAATGTGHLMLDVEIPTAINSPSSSSINQATVRYLVNPYPQEGAANTFTVYFSCAETPQAPMPAGTQAKLSWNHAMYRWELVPTGASILVKPVSNIAKSASGSCAIYAGTQGSETATGDTLTAYARAGAVTTTKWCYVSLVNGRLEVALADC